MYSRLSSSACRLAVVTTLATLSVCALATTGHAQTFYTNANAFHGVVPTAKVYDFEDIAPTGFTANPSLRTISFLVSGGTDPQIYAASPVFGRGAYSLDGSSSLLAGLSSRSGATTTRIDLGQTYTAFAVEVGQSGNKTNRYTVRLYKGNTQVGYFCDMGVRKRFFIGVTSALPFDNVRITARNQTGSYTLFDNVQVGDISSGGTPSRNTKIATAR